MTYDDDFITQLEGYLDEYQGATPLPDVAREAVRARVQTTAQVGPWRTFVTSRTMQFALVAAAAVFVAIIGFRSVLVGPTPGTSPSEEPSPSASASATAQSSAFDGLLTAFVNARVAGEGAEQYRDKVTWADGYIPLLYATTSGAAYERGEFQEVQGIEWPYGWTAFQVRLFAGDTMVEQLVFVDPASSLVTYVPDGFGTHIAPTTENGQPLPEPYATLDGHVTLFTIHPWVARWNAGSIRLIPDDKEVGPSIDGGQRADWDLMFLEADPETVGPVGEGCPVGEPAADAATLAESVRSSTDFETTAPIAVTAGGADGLMMDVMVASGAQVCDGGVFRALVASTPGSVCEANAGLMNCDASGEWMRLYLFDAPVGSSMQVLAIMIMAPESRFESVVDSAAPMIDTLEFHSP